MTAHPLDHIVLPTADLDAARARLTALGFTVAPNGVHPFGTANCCVYLCDGTFMEPLALADREQADGAIGAGNVFVARDRLYRQRLGEEGFSAVVFGTGNADADHARYVEAGISAGARLDFSRSFVDASGKSDTASFRLAFASGRDTPDAFVVSCERANAPKVDRSALQVHANGARAMAEIVAVSGDPGPQGRLLAKAAGAKAKDRAESSVIALPNGGITLLDPAAFEKRFRLSAGHSTTLRFAAVVFAVPARDVTQRALVAGGITHHVEGAALVVPPAPGQGAAFIFEERP